MNDSSFEYDKEKRDELYGKLSQSLSKERIDLLYRYFEAINTFYQLIPLQKVFEIINSQNEEQYSEEDFLLFTEMVQNEHHYYFILGREEFYDDAPESKPFEKELMHESLCEFDDLYYGMDAAKGDKPYYVPSKNELLKYESQYHHAKNAYYNAMSKFIHKNISHDSETVDGLMDELLFTVQSDDSSPDSALEFIENFAIKINLSADEYKEYVKLYVDLHNNTRNPYNNGYTPAEMLEITNDREKSRYLKESTFMNAFTNVTKWQKTVNEPIRSKKIGRNEPCPCGSGKKYKKCCGR